MESTEKLEPIVEHWSKSSLLSFLDDPMNFKKVYIEKIYDKKTSPSAMVGKACHAAIAQYLKTRDHDSAYRTGLNHIEATMDIEIDFGKTGSREKILKEYTAGLNLFWQEAPDFWSKGEILGVETSTVTYITDEKGQQFPIPLKCIRDLDYKNAEGEGEYIDYKFVRGYTDADEQNPEYIVQSMFGFFTFLADYGVAPKRSIFYEVKLSKNGDNTPQAQPYIIEYEKYPQYFTFFYKILHDATTQICNPSYLFLPNLRAMFSGTDSFEMYLGGLMGAEAPVAVPFKTEQKQFVEKHFVPSEHDRVQSIHLTQAEKIRTKLQEFGLPVKMEDEHAGGSVTLYTCKPSKGVRMSEIAKHGKDIAIALEAQSVRILAPIPGTSLVGIEIPNKEKRVITLSDIHFTDNPMQIPIGQDVYDNTISKDIREMPHLLVAGSTGSGKSVFINVLIKSLMKQNTPDNIRMILIDPKEVELAEYEDSPFLLQPIITDEEEARHKLQELVQQMNRRYKTLRAAKCKTIYEYNSPKRKNKMVPIVVIIDEFADLIMSDQKTSKSKKAQTSIRNAATKELAKAMAKKGTIMEPEVAEMIDSVEDNIIRLAQKARAVGIHLVIATQRPSVDVITGRIKSNIATRIAFMTSSSVDSKIILDQGGAEELTGKGDMLFLDPSRKGLTRLQGFMC